MPEDINEPTADQILKLADVFPDIPKTRQAHKGIGMALKGFEHYEEGLDECRKGLNGADDDLERFDTIGSVLQALVRLSNTETDESKKAEYLRDARETAAEAFDISERVYGHDRTSLITPRHVANFWYQADIALLEDDTDAAIRHWRRASSLDKESNVNMPLLDSITAKFEEQKKYKELIDFVESMSELDRAVWLNYYNDSTFQRACFETSKHDFLVETYNMTFKFPGLPVSASDRLRCMLADYHQRVTEDFQMAKVGTLRY